MNPSPRSIYGWNQSFVHVLSGSIRHSVIAAKKLRTKQTFVLGAGASFGATAHLAVPCPMVSQVISAAARIGLLDGHYAAESNKQLKNRLARSGAEFGRLKKLGLTLPEGGHLALLKEFINEQFGIKERDLTESPIDFELLMGLADAELLGWHAHHRSRGEIPLLPTDGDRLEQQVHLTLCGSLIHTTADLRCPLHQALSERLAVGDTIVSFNYDLLMDRALLANGRWSQEDGYGLDFYRMGIREGADVRWRAPARTMSRVELLKPHGSINWLHCRTPAEALIKARLHGANTPQCEKLFCLTDMHREFPEDHPVYEWCERYEHEEDNIIFGLYSLIVPPIASKPYRELERHLGSVWARAFEALVLETTDLYVIGYSLRADDIRSRWLFRKVAQESELLRTVHVIGPDANVVRRAQEIFHNREVRHTAESLKEFVEA